jgi:hypothetical protein
MYLDQHRNHLPWTGFLTDYTLKMTQGNQIG